MQVLIKGQQREITIQTISLVPETDANILHSFHCSVCGNIIHQYEGRVVKIYPILEPYDRLLTVAGCRKCGARVTFQTHPEYKNTTIKVVLHAVPDQKTTFHCIDHFSDPLLLFNDLAIYSYAHKKPMKIPFEASCIYLNSEGQNCNKTYLFADLV